MLGYSNLWLSITAIILDTVLLLVYHRQKTSGLRQERMFGLMLWNLFGLNLTAVLYSVVLQTIGEVLLYDRIFSWLATLFIALVPKTFLQYLNSVFYYDTAQKRASLIVTAVSVASFIAIVMLGPIVICAGRNILLRLETGRYLLVGEAALFLTIGFIQGFLLRKSVSKRHLWAVRAILIICVVSLLMFGFYHTVPSYGFLLSLCPLLCEFTLEKRSMIVDQETGLRSHSAYYISVSTRLKQNLPFRLILVHAGNLSSLIARLTDVAGDRVMEKLSSYFRNVTENPVFRINEDTFAIVQDDRNEAETQEIIIGLRTKFSTPFKAENQATRLQVTYCIVDLPREIKNMQDLEIASELLVQKHDHFHDRTIRVADLDIESEKTLRSQIHDLNIGLREKRIEVWYQPILSTKTNRFEAAEALVRMKDAGGGYVRPDFFIPAAEKSGLILDVGSEVFRQVCEFLSSKEREEIGIHYIEANLSVEEAIQEFTAEHIHAIMEEYNTRPETLNIEVTETANDMASELMMRNIVKIHDEYGIELSLDDFGTGYSNIARMLSMPLEIIKFDRSLLLKAFESERGRLVFERFARMVHAIGKKIVSEGVETEEQAEFVKSLNIEYIQGFYYAKPMPKEEFISFIRRNQP